MKRPVTLDIIVYLGILATALAEAEGIVPGALFRQHFLFIFASPVLLWMSRDLEERLKPPKEYYVTFTVMGYGAADYFLIRSGEFQVLYHFLSVMVLAFCFKEQDRRIFYIIYSISLVNITIAAGTTQAIWFSILFFTFLVCSVGAFIAFQRGTAVLHAKPWTSGRRVQEGLTFTTILLFLLAGTAVIFAMIPRVRAEFLTRSFGESTKMVGLTENFNLGDIRQFIRSPNPEAVLRVHSAVPQFWRAISYDNFDGKKWTITYKYPQIERQPDFKWLWNPDKLPPGHRLEQEVEILLENNRFVFTALTPVAVEINVPGLYYDPVGQSLQTRGILPKGFSYILHTVQPENDPGKLRGATGTDYPKSLKTLYLQLPRFLNPRITDLATTIAGKKNSPYEKAQAIKLYLLQNYQYTTDLNPLYEKGIDEFLFDVKAGHCKYFSSAMAVLCRAAGVPSRVVTGFTSGVYNDLRGYYLINQNNSHAWVEIFLQGIGWIPMNPTPVSLEESKDFRALAALLKDEVGLGWQKYIIDYGSRMQQTLFQKIKDELKSLVDGLLKFRSPVEWRRIFKSLTTAGWLSVALGLLMVALAILWGRVFARWGQERLRRMFSQRDPLPPVARQVEKTLRILERHGLPRMPGWTVQEYALKLKAAGHPLASETVRLTDLYYQARFGGAPEDGILKDLKALAREIRAKAGKGSRV